VDNQSAFWPLHPYVYRKTFPAFPFSPATATVATERKNGNGTMTRHNGTAERNGKTATAEWQRNGGNQALVHHINTMVFLITQQHHQNQGSRHPVRHTQKKTNPLLTGKPTPTEFLNNFSISCH